jgi:GNAT superfamily N-acetyltransferase
MTVDGLEAGPADHDIPDWSGGPDGSQMLAEYVTFCRGHMMAGAQGLGYFTHEGRMVGVGVMRPEVEPGVAQLAYLAVSRPYRRHGVGGALLHRLISWAAAQGATEIYVSSAPREPAVAFYHRAGFVVTERPIAELQELEPYDIQMRLSLTTSDGGDRHGPGDA